MTTSRAIPGRAIKDASQRALPLTSGTFDIGITVAEMMGSLAIRDVFALMKS